MRNALNLRRKAAGLLGCAKFLLALFFAAPELAFCENGKLGGVSIATSQLVIVVPEHFEPISVKVEQGRLSACGHFSQDVSFLSINGNSTELLKPKSGVSNCKTGQIFVSPTVKEGTSIFVPSSVF